MRHIIKKSVVQFTKTLNNSTDFSYVIKFHVSSLSIRQYNVFVLDEINSILLFGIHIIYTFLCILLLMCDN